MNVRLSSRNGSAIRVLGYRIGFQVMLLLVGAPLVAAAQGAPAAPATTARSSIKDQIESAEQASESDIARDRRERTAEHAANEAAIPAARRKEEAENAERSKKDEAEFARKLAHERENMRSLEFDKVEVMQAGDLQKSCPALQAEAENVQQVVVTLDKRIGSDADVTNAPSAPCLVAGAGCELANQLVAIAQNGAAGDARKLQDVRTSYQKRHDFLMSQIYAKRCR